MDAREAWAELHRRRFAALPFDCGNAVDPGVVDSEEFRDWTAKRTSADQRLIERYLDRFDLRSRRLLHIGIGNSSLARCLGGRAKLIVGTTIDGAEVGRARSLAIPDYDVLLHNKYADASSLLPGKFDFIIDNNPSSACCCISHLAALFEVIAAKLAPDGVFVTSREGLEWVAPGIHPRFGFDFDDLAEAAATVGLRTWKVDGDIYLLSRGVPRRPDRWSNFKSRLRAVTRKASAAPDWARRLPARIAGKLGRSTR